MKGLWAIALPIELNQREFMRRVGLATACAALPGLARSQQAGGERRPNILYIMADDHAAQAIGAYGGRLAKLNPTPVIDGLAREGMVLENCFCSNSICTPSRAQIMTGQYRHINGILFLDQPLPPERHTLAIEMRKAGYQTAMIGKWHLSTEPNFDYYKVQPGQGLYFDPQFNDKAAGAWPANMVKATGHVTDVITDNALAWLKRRDKTRPFFLMLHHKAPHDMFQYAPKYEEYLKIKACDQRHNIADGGDESVRRSGGLRRRRHSGARALQAPQRNGDDRRGHVLMRPG